MGLRQLLLEVGVFVAAQRDDGAAGAHHVVVPLLLPGPAELDVLEPAAADELALEQRIVDPEADQAGVPVVGGLGDAPHQLAVGGLRVDEEGLACAQAGAVLHQDLGVTLQVFLVHVGPCRRAEILPDASGTRCASCGRIERVRMSSPRR